METFSPLIESRVYAAGKEPVMPAYCHLRDYGIRKLIQNVEESVNLQKEFVNLAAHELRNPYGYYFHFTAKCHNYILLH